MYKEISKLGMGRNSRRVWRLRLNWHNTDSICHSFAKFDSDLLVNAKIPDIYIEIEGPCYYSKACGLYWCVFTHQFNAL